MDLPEPAQLRFASRYYNTIDPRLGLDSKNAQYSPPVLLEQYVRGLPNYVGNPMRADIVIVPFYPIFYGLHPHIYPGPLNVTASSLSQQLLPAIEQLPNTTVLVFVIAQLDEFIVMNKYLLSHIRPARPRRIVTLRTDMGDTVCKCYARPFWGDGLENIVIPYAVMVPREFISQEARAVPEPGRNITLFFRGGASTNHHRALVVAGLQAQNRPDVDVALVVMQPNGDGEEEEWSQHEAYLASLMRSKFCLITEGDVSTTLRLYEAIVAGCVPVIVSDCMDVAFDGLEPVGDYSKFTMQLPLTTSGADIVRQLDTLVSSGGYARLKSHLDAIWPNFTFHNGLLPQPTAAQLAMRQVYDAAQRMEQGLPLVSDGQTWARRHCRY